jgi:hypothetical protein
MRIKSQKKHFSTDRTSSLSSISERHAVMFGKASSCENPILIRLNDREKFREAFRAENPPPPPPVADKAPTTVVPASPTADTLDDIPF